MHQPLRPKGLRDLSPLEISFINDLSDLGARIQMLLSQIEEDENLEADYKWFETCQTHLQMGLMFVKRAIGRPLNF